MASAKAQKRGKSLKIAREMSAPTVMVEGLTVSGDGLALAGVSIEQDAAYWEWHIEEGTSKDVMFGVATQKDRQFYRELENAEEGRLDVWHHFEKYEKIASKLKHTPLAQFHHILLL